MEGRQTFTRPKREKEKSVTAELEVTRGILLPGSSEEGYRQDLSRIDEVDEWQKAGLESETRSRSTKGVNPACNNYTGYETMPNSITELRDFIIKNVQDFHHHVSRPSYRSRKPYPAWIDSVPFPPGKLPPGLISDWDSLVARFHKHFYSTHRSVGVTELTEAKQRQHESVDGFLLYG
ncbi:hypothetical protein Pint_21238 [Pistacia integerrima]|uniref:Uncharacterized protein n=1 Tax=Pistacia integerrima TaxID=434235 RepID=A0ACC0XD57_9ROSI|nr:hypothetical protein Pint_21238 [Pistacia integerrima]KAJ0074679.1 hypothetical protein Patl1_37486 [Pistacia atlantica]